MNQSSTKHISMIWSKTVVVALLALALAFSPMAQNIASANTGTEQPKALTTSSAEEFLEEFFSAAHIEPQYIGASVVIVKDGQVLAEKGYGYADTAAQLEVNPQETTFRVASVSKSINAIAVMQLVEQGNIDLQEDIRVYLPSLTFDNPYSKPVTVEHLLAHTTGFEIRDPKPEDIHGDLERVVGIEEYVHKHMPPVVREPGSSYMYDNFASLLAGLLVEEVSGVPYQDYMDEHVFQPLGMNNSGFLLEGSLLEQLATGYDAAGQAMEVYTVTPTVMPHGGMISTAEDLGKFMIAFLNEGDSEELQLSAESIELMQEYRSEIHPLWPDTTNGFEASFQFPLAGSSSEILTKGGDLPGFSSYLFMIPEENTGVFLTYNQSGVLRNFFYSEFISTFFPQYSEPVDLAPFQPQSPEQLERLTGYYADLRLRSLVTTIQVGEDGALSISDGFLGPRALQQVDENLFVDPISNQFVAFQVDQNGKAEYLREPNLNPYGYAQKGEEAKGFSDVNEQHLYAPYILPLQSLGYYPNDSNLAFNPEHVLTRGEYVEQLLTVSGIPGSQTEQIAFPDVVGHPKASYIQMAYELGMITGDEKGNFGPDRVITRQEAATMNWRLLHSQYPPGAFDEIQLAGEVSEWAIPAVQMMLGLGLHGPEVEAKEDGSIDFLAKKELTKQEDAAILFMMFTQPTYLIAEQLVTSPAVDGVDEEEVEALEEDAA
ncbi:serine hydrolase [Caldalkalibacillus horti]|uniref:CubicO group peptidase (Beta-lactamase class C family) n=1 Tax=Caldalkalibacillus horti TaxID=77523 RepID=A0ABT9VXC0_9BACI|nr:serine hydrolase [Bacillus horti]MDQ0165641.1 CubicO group peptidase (beta-lactamase class C family) [Bacillus horti]